MNNTEDNIIEIEHINNIEDETIKDIGEISRQRRRSLDMTYTLINKF